MGPSRAATRPGKGQAREPAPGRRSRLRPPAPCQARLTTWPAPAH